VTIREQTSLIEVPQELLVLPGRLTANKASTR